jgi:hypothetical protein
LKDAGLWAVTRLRTELDGIDPDEAYTLVPYEKGALLLLALEQAVGRTAWDAFVRTYLAAFRFDVLTSEQFVDFLGQHLPAAVRLVDVDRWLYQPGVPEQAPTLRSTRLDAIEALAGARPTDAQAHAWGATEWQLYLDSLAAPLPVEQLAELDQRFALTGSRNYDVLEKWLSLGIRSGYEPALARVEQVVASIGRMKYLRPLYTALAERDPALAQRLFEQNARRYHPIARQVVASVLKPTTHRT